MLKCPPPPRGDEGGGERSDGGEEGDGGDGDGGDGGARYAVVCTSRTMKLNLVQWAAYHASLGFSPVFAYLDDPDEADWCVRFHFHFHSWGPHYIICWSGEPPCADKTS